MEVVPSIPLYYVLADVYAYPAIPVTYEVDGDKSCIIVWPSEADRIQSIANRSPVTFTVLSY